VSVSTHTHTHTKGLLDHGVNLVFICGTYRTSILKVVNVLFFKQAIKNLHLFFSLFLVISHLLLIRDLHLLRLVQLFHFRVSQEAIFGHTLTSFVLQALQISLVIPQAD